MLDLDVHTHLVPIHAERLAGFDGVRWLPDEYALLVDGHRIGIRSLFEPARLIAWMDRNGVRRALVSIPPLVYRQHLPEPQSITWVRYLNEELSAACAASEGRLGALFYLPLEHLGALTTLLRDFEHAAFEGVALAAGGNPAIEYSHLHYGPLWEWLDARGAFAFMHPGACADTRLARFYLENLVGNPFETGLAAAHLVMAGVPARYPSIRFCLAHAGGAFTGLVGRLQRGFDTARPGVDLALEPPLQAARRFYADGIAHHPSALRMAQDVFGAERILFGSDWPFPMGLDEPGP